jgi:membrane protease YdiL (CAAX protease family)
LADTHSDRRLSLPGAALWTLALWLVEHVCFEMTEAARPGAITDIINVSGCVVLATSIVVFAILRVHGPDESLRAALGLRSLGPLRLALCAAAGVGLGPALASLDDLVARRWPYDDPEVLENMQKLLGSSTRIALVVAVFVVIPLAREVFFRGILYGELRKGVSTFTAVAATSLLFTVFSLDWRSMPSALVLSLCLGWLRACGGSVIASVVAHLAFWSVQGVPILRGADPSAGVMYPVKWSAGGLALALLALVAAGFGKTKEDRGTNVEAARR